MVSADRLNHGPAELVVALPVSAVDRGIASHVPIERSEGRGESYVVCERPFSVSRGRLRLRIGRVGSTVMNDVARYLRVLLEL